MRKKVSINLDYNIEGHGQISMKKCKGDPRRITARFNSNCFKCNAKIIKGTTAYYWPNSRTIMCSSCGEAEYRQFLSMAADQDAYNGFGNPY